MRSLISDINPVPNDNFSVEVKLLKCPHQDCPYGPNGQKIFKTQRYLEQHIKTVHEERKFHCNNCDQKFGIQWQLKFHLKHCGKELTCETCFKCYKKPTALWMHCKRSKHQLPTTMIQKSKVIEPNNFFLVPVTFPIVIPETFSPNYVLNCNLTNNKLILPNNNLNNGNNSQIQTSNSLSLLNTNELDLNNKNGKSKRSSYCQTARNRQRNTSKQTESVSTHTQTSSSSFDLLSDIESSSFLNRNQSPINVPSSSKSTCSSFTQTFFDCNEIDYLLQTDKDPFLIKTIDDDDDDTCSNVCYEESSLLNDVPSNNLVNNNQYQTIETQTNFWDQDSELLSDFTEFVDIETQTIWNYDQTTQTDNNDIKLFTNEHPDWPNFLS